MPLEIMSERLYLDRFFQDWHRKRMPAEADGIDLDFIGVCHSWKCRAPLYAIESTTRNNKPTTILKRLATGLGCTGIVVIHDTVELIDFQVIYSPLKFDIPYETNIEARLTSYLGTVRHIHDLTHLTP